jgi:mono/diheme cytochrome c family protein
MILPRCCRASLALAGCVAATGLAADSVTLSRLPAPAAQPVDFIRDIEPIFARACLSCHGPEAQKGGFRLDSRTIAMTGGDHHAPNIRPGRSAESPLIHFVAGLVDDMVMPAKGERLTTEQIGLLRAWIDQGADWPDSADNFTPDNPLDWWSLKPLVRPVVPNIKSEIRSSKSEPNPKPEGRRAEIGGHNPTAGGSEPSDLVRFSNLGFRIFNPIDAFIVAKLEEHSLPQSPEADPRTLIRRLYFDLIGLPPTPEEVEAFVRECGGRSAEIGMSGKGAAADSAFHIPHSALERLVDRLLASPHHGERWARHWLDVVHYGDTHGYDKDKPRPNAWPYRDYVIRAFNDDKPYGRFVQEQIAGDVLFPGTQDGIVALGFIAAGPWDLISHVEVPETKTDGKIARHLDRDDMVMNTIQTFNSLTVQCAQCHNHKFDPIRQEDYYSLQAVFAALDRADRKYFADTALTHRFNELEGRQRRLGERKRALDEAVKNQAGPKLAELDTHLEAARKRRGNQRAEYGYHSAIANEQGTVKWVQADLGRSVVIDQIALLPCHDDFNNIGAGFGFPLRFKVEVCDDPEFRTGPIIVAARLKEDVRNPGTAPERFEAHGATGRYVRVTALKLAPRQDDFIFALAELQVLDSTGNNVAAGAPVAALDSIERPPRWARANLVDAIAPAPDPSGELARLQAEREALVERAAGPATHRELAEVNRSLAEVNAELGRFPKPDVVYAGTVHHGTGNFRGTGPDGGRPRPIHILHRGDVLKPGQPAAPGALTALAALPARFDLPPDHGEGDRRAALAKWLTDPHNPLTWRSIVNRVWHYHFGRGLVETANDFGRNGALPTHPELLDWLAVEFRDGGQSLKRLHKLIVMSATYRQQSNAERGAQNAESVPRSDFRDPSLADADNRFLWRMNRRRLEAEAVRDSVLFVSGRLDRRMFGPGFQDFVIEKPEHSPHYGYQLHDPDDPRSHRRSIYRFIVRSQLQPFMTTLDCADPSIQVDRRNQSLSPLQALTLLNNGLMVTMSKHFAAKLDAAAGTVAGKVDRAFREAVGRAPTTEEKQTLVAYAEQHGLANACRVLFNLNEFVFVD